MISFQSTGQDGFSFCLVESNVFQVISTSYSCVECIYYITQLNSQVECVYYITQLDSTITTIHPCYHSPDTVLYKEVTASLHVALFLLKMEKRGARWSYPTFLHHCDSTPQRHYSLGNTGTERQYSLGNTGTERPYSLGNIVSSTVFPSDSIPCYTGFIHR